MSEPARTTRYGRILPRGKIFGFRNGHGLAHVFAVRLALGRTGRGPVVAACGPGRVLASAAGQAGQAWGGFP
eukprot:1922518-Alexandrium_andersonii.AAC.1